MIPLLYCFCMVFSPVAAPPGLQVLLGAEEWYRAAREKETIFEGIVERNPGDGRLGAPSRFNAFRLTWTDGAGKPAMRELYLPGKAYLLADHVGKKLRLRGKAVDTEVEGKTYREIWPASLELTGLATADEQNADGIRARCFWQPNQARALGKRTYVIRNGRELAELAGIKGAGAIDESATALLASRLNLASIDWSRHMLVTVCAGLTATPAQRLTVTRVAPRDGLLVVYYRLGTEEGPAEGFGYPAETVLVDRYIGEVRFEREPALPER